MFGLNIVVMIAAPCVGRKIPGDRSTAGWMAHKKSETKSGARVKDPVSVHVVAGRTKAGLDDRCEIISRSRVTGLADRRAMFIFAGMHTTACGFSLAALVVIGSSAIVSAGDDRPDPSFRTGPDIASSNDIDVDTLTDDLGSTDSIDFITKLELNDELDNLIEAFRKFHDGSDDHSLAALYARFDRLLRTTLDLIEDGDPPLFLKLKQSRSRLWQVLVDREEFHAAMEGADVALLKGSARHSCCR
jgi:hypothetical protein